MARSSLCSSPSKWGICRDEPGAGCKSTLDIDGKKVAEGQIPKTQPFAFSGVERADVGLDGEANVSSDSKQGDNAFTGTIMTDTIERSDGNRR